MLIEESRSINSLVLRNPRYKGRKALRISSYEQCGAYVGTLGCGGNNCGAERGVRCPYDIPRAFASNPGFELIVYAEIVTGVCGPNDYLSGDLDTFKMILGEKYPRDGRVKGIDSTPATPPNGTIITPVINENVSTIEDAERAFAIEEQGANYHTHRRNNLFDKLFG